ncbi:MAG TPA: tetratricopeptide repeat protein [Gemmatimonadaceae bacterium]
MSNIAKLKKKAAEFELKKQPDKALAVYIELLAEYDSSPEEIDVALFNRVGDLLLRQGNVGDAVDYYERAVDHYSEGGFFNNAIALCNKILRQSPGRTSIYYKLGKISAQKGFTAEAKRNFLEFADRMQKTGRLDEAFRALKEFADLCPDQDDIRLMLADQLQKTGKPHEAVEQLQLLYQRYTAEGRPAEAEATAARIRSIDPDAEVSAGDTPLETKSQDLVFLDLNEAPRPRGSTPRPARSQPEPEVPAPKAAPATEQPPSANGMGPDAVEAEPLEGVTRGAEFDDEAPAAGTSTPVDGLVATSFDVPDDVETAASLLDLEPTALAEDEEAPDEAPLVDEGEERAATAAESSGDAEAVADAGGAEGVDDDLELMVPEEALGVSEDESPVNASPTHGLPLMDLESLRAARDAEEEEEAEGSEELAPAVPRASTMLAARSVEMLQAVVEGNPADWAAHRELGEAMFEAGNRDGGLAEFETAMKGYETDGNLEAAASIADELVRTDPSSVRFHQKRVEYAFRSNDKHRLVDAYLELADALFRVDQSEKARVIYHRVLELAPDNARAQGALGALAETPSSAMLGSTLGTPSRPRMSIPTPVRGEFVNLGDLMRDEERPKDTRMVVEEQEPTGDEEADFADMLRKFKQGVAENVDADDYQSHYDLGVAYKEMGLLDDAIAEFQKSLRGVDNRVRTYEAIGQCFMEKEQYQMASTLLSRAVHERGVSDEKLIGVLYLLGRACEALGKPDDALQHYQRIFVIDMQFRDVGERMNAIEEATR